MIVLAISYFSSFFIAFFSLFSCQRNSTTIIYVIWFLLAATKLSGFGSDMQIYVDAYYDLQKSWELSHASAVLYGWEPGYLLSMLLAKNIGINSPYVFFSIIALFNFFIVNYSTKSLSVAPAITAFFYVSTYFIWDQFVLIRQSIAVSFCLLAFSFLFRRKYILSVLLSIIACFFHYSAIIVPVCISILFASSFFNRRLLIVFSVLLSLISLLVFDVFWGLLIGFFDGSFLRDYLIYVDFGSVNFLPLAESTALLVVIIFLLSQGFSFDRQGDFLFSIFLIIFPLIVLSTYLEIFTRFLEYFRILTAALLACLIVSIKEKRMMVFLFYVISGYMAVRFFRMMLKFDDGVLLEFKTWVLG